MEKQERWGQWKSILGKMEMDMQIKMNPQTASMNHNC
jgi:hypothetical protein